MPDSPLWTHWRQVTHMCISKLAILGSDNGLSPGRRQTIIWTNAGILLIGPLWTNFSEILIEIYTFSLKKIHLKMLSGKWWPFGLGLNVLRVMISLLPAVWSRPSLLVSLHIVDTDPDYPVVSTSTCRNYFAPLLRPEDKTHNMIVDWIPCLCDFKSMALCKIGESLV